MFHEIAPKELCESPFSLIGNDWLLITAPDETKECGANAMTMAITTAVTENDIAKAI